VEGGLGEVGGGIKFQMQQISAFSDRLVLGKKAG
jgi:hypothetical protein